MQHSSEPTFPLPIRIPMFRFTIRNVLCPVVVLAILGNGVVVGAEPTLKEMLNQADNDLSFDERYSLSIIKHLLSDHAGSQVGAENRLAVVSWFGHEGRVVYRYAVTDDGYSYDMRLTTRSAQAFSQKTLSAADKEQLATLLSRLPESKSEPPIGRTVHISFQASGKWRTETYDADSLPEPFEDVMKVLGERFETKDRQKGKPAKP